MNLTPLLQVPVLQQEHSQQHSVQQHSGWWHHHHHGWSLACSACHTTTLQF